MLKSKKSKFKYERKSLLIRSILVFISDILIALAVVLNKTASLGNDPVAVFYDGLHNCLNVSLGLATHITNVALLICLYIFSRKYINIGTFLYTLPLGFIISLVDKFILSLKIPDNLTISILESSLGCLSLFLGLALFISSNIGVDVWTGLSLFLKDKFKKDFKFVKILVDIVTATTGYLMGGKIGLVTIIAAILGGPLIQKFTRVTDKLILKITEKIQFKGE